ncbi:MAG TPA: hypothetical protein VGG74_36055 [Kofleriaceae bacterium]
MRFVVVALALTACGFSPETTQDGATQPDAPVALDSRGPADAMPATVQFVQSATGWADPWNNGGSTVAATFAANVAAGDVIALYVSYAGGTSIDTITDTLGNTYAVVDTIDDSDDSQKATTAYATSAGGGVGIVTVTFKDSKCCRVVIAHELAGADPTSPLDGYSGHEDGSPGTQPDDVTSDSMTTAADRDYIFAATSNASNESGETITAGTGLSLRVDDVVPSGNPTVSEDRQQATHGATTSTFTYSKNGAALTMQMAFKPPT